MYNFLAALPRWVFTLLLREFKKQDLPVLHHILFSLGPYPAGGPERSLRFVRFKVFHGVDIGPYEPFFKIAVDGAGRLRCRRKFRGRGACKVRVTAARDRSLFAPWFREILRGPPREGH
jgi:hypothetical protein